MRSETAPGSVLEFPGRRKAFSRSHAVYALRLTKKTRGNKAREFLLSLSMQRVLERHGKGPGSYYTLRGE